MTSTHTQLRLFTDENTTDHPGTVYAMLLPSRMVKFGWTSRPVNRRARELNGEILACTHGSRADEHALHTRLAEWRIGRTEDFWPTPPVWRAVDELAAGWPSGWPRERRNAA